MSYNNRVTVTQIPLVFVFFGEVPKYAIRSLVHARSFHEPRPIWLITDREQNLPSCLEINSLIINLTFDWVESKIPPKLKDFRKGFWLRTIERFFALDHFVSKTGISKFWHAEIDNLVFDLSAVERQCLDSNGCLLIPSDHPSRCIASLIFIDNTSDLLGDLCMFFTSNLSVKFDNDMHLLRRFAELDERVVMLPAAPASISDYASTNTITLDKYIFDAAAFGQFLFGIDLRNGGLFTQNGFVNEKVDFDPRAPKYFWDGKNLQARLGSETCYLVNLHNHSKVFFGAGYGDMIAPSLRSDGTLQRQWVGGRVGKGIFCNPLRSGFGRLLLR